MLGDQPRQPLDRQAEIPDRPQQFGRDRIALDAAMALACQEVGPPLQAHFPGQRLADLLTHPGNLDIEGIDRQQRAAFDRRHEQRGGVARKIMGAHQIGAECRGILAVGRCSWHRDQRRGDAPAFAHHDVVGADGRSGLHRVQHDLHLAQGVAERPRRHPDVRAGADDQGVDAVGRWRTPDAANTRRSPRAPSPSQAQIASGRQSSEPRCDMSAKAKPPLP